MQQLALVSDARAEFSVFNPALSVWEPLLEDWRFCLEGHVHAAASPTVFDIHLQTSAPCSLNFSYSICELLSETVVTLY